MLSASDLGTAEVKDSDLTIENGEDGELLTIFGEGEGGWDRLGLFEVKQIRRGLEFEDTRDSC